MQVILTPVINTRDIDIASNNKVEQNENVNDVIKTSKNLEIETPTHEDTSDSNWDIPTNDASKDNNDNEVVETESGGNDIQIVAAVPPNPTAPSTGSAKPKSTWKPEPEDIKNARKAWQQWGCIVYSHDWNIQSKSSIEGLVKAVDKLTDDLYCKMQKATFKRLSSSTFSLDKVKELPIMKFLHLRSADNDVSKEIEHHLKVVYDSNVVMVNYFCYDFIY